MTIIKPYTLVLRGVLQDTDGRFLLMQRSVRGKGWPGKWEFPGGKVDPGEEIGAALVREWKEETGLDILVDHFVDAFEWEREQDRILYLVFRVKSVSSAPVLISDEHDAFGWFDRQAMRALDISPALNRVVEMLCA